MCTRNYQKENQNWLVKLQQVTPSRSQNHSSRAKKQRRMNQSSAQKKKRVSGNLLKFFAVQNKKEETPSADQCESDDGFNSGISSL